MLLGQRGVSTKPECLCCADQGKCSLEVSSQAPGFQRLCFIWRRCTWFSNLALACGVSWFYMGLPTSLQQLIIRYFCPVLRVFPFSCILSLSLILRLFALAQIFPDKVLTEQTMGGRESIFPSLGLWNLMRPCVFFPFPPPCNGVSRVCFHLWTRVWGFQEVGGSEASMTAVSRETPYCWDMPTAEASPKTRMWDQALEITTPVLLSVADIFIGFDHIFSIVCS